MKLWPWSVCRRNVAFRDNVTPSQALAAMTEKAGAVASVAETATALGNSDGITAMFTGNSQRYRCTSNPTASLRLRGFDRRGSNSYDSLTHNYGRYVTEIEQILSVETMLLKC